MTKRIKSYGGDFAVNHQGHIGNFVVTYVSKRTLTNAMSYTNLADDFCITYSDWIENAFNDNKNRILTFRKHERLWLCNTQIVFDEHNQR